MPECKDCYHALPAQTGAPLRCGKSPLGPGNYAPVGFARSLPRPLAWFQGECGKPGRFFEPRYPF